MVKKKAVSKKVIKKPVKKSVAKKPISKKTASAGKDNPEDIMKYIKLAIETEKRGIRFYTEAKRNVNDYNMTQLMDVLLEQEAIHLSFFKKVLAAQKKGTNDAAAAAKEYKGQKQIKNPLFRMDKIHDLAKKESTILDIFRQAVEFEEDGNHLYLDLAKQIKNPEIKRFLQMVAREELKHRDFIMMHQDSIYNTGHWFGMEHVRLET